MEKKDTEGYDVRKCTYCRAVENEVRLVGNFLVELTEIEIDGTAKLACQSCKIKVREAREAIQKSIGF